MKATGLTLSTLLCWCMSLTLAQAQDVSSQGRSQPGWETVHAHQNHTPPGHSKPPGSGTPVLAELFTCGNAVIELLRSSCGSMGAKMFVMNGGVSAGVILPQVAPFTFDSSNSSAAFTFETLSVFCPSNFAVIFQGTQNGAPASVGVCVCDATNHRSGCAPTATKYSFDAQEFPQLNGLTVTQVLLVLYGGGDVTSASAFKFEFNSNSLVSGFHTHPIQCPTLPPNPCGG